MEEVVNSPIHVDSEPRVDLFRKELILQSSHVDESFTTHCLEKILTSLLSSVEFISIVAHPVCVLSSAECYSYTLTPWKQYQKSVSSQFYMKRPISNNVKDDLLIPLPTPSLHPFNVFTYELPPDIPIQHLPLYLSDDSDIPSYSLQLLPQPSYEYWSPVHVPFMESDEEFLPLIFLPPITPSPIHAKCLIPSSLTITTLMPNHLINRTNEMDLFQYAGSFNTRSLLPLSLCKQSQILKDPLKEYLIHSLESIRLVSLLSKTIQLGLLFGGKVMNQIKVDLMSILEYSLQRNVKWRRLDSLYSVCELITRKSDSLLSQSSQDQISSMQQPVSQNQATQQILQNHPAQLVPQKLLTQVSQNQSVQTQSTQLVPQSTQSPKSPDRQQQVLPHQSLLDEISFFASQFLSYLQQQSLLPSSSSLSSLTTDTLSSFSFFILIY